VKETLLLLSIAVLCLSTFASADSFTYYTSRAQQNPDDIIDWGQLGPPLSLINTPALVFSARIVNRASPSAGPRERESSIRCST